MLVPLNYRQEILSLEDAEYLKVKNTGNTFFGETEIVEISGSFFKSKSKVA